MSYIHNSLLPEQQWELAKQIAREPEKTWTQITNKLQLGYGYNEESLMKFAHEAPIEVSGLLHAEDKTDVLVMCMLAKLSEDHFTTPKLIETLYDLRFVKTLTWMRSKFSHLNVPIPNGLPSYPEPPSIPKNINPSDVLAQLNAFTLLVNEKLDKLESLFSRVEKLESMLSQGSATQQQVIETPKQVDVDNSKLSSLNVDVLSEMAETLSGYGPYSYRLIAFNFRNVCATEESLKKIAGPNATPLELMRTTLDQLVNAGVQKSELAKVVSEKLKFPFFVLKFSQHLGNQQ